MMRTGQTADRRARFPGLGERAVMLQRCFACDVADAKAAWNDYVLRYVDGQLGTDHQLSCGRHQ
jgi:hypothetical protein